MQWRFIAVFAVVCLEADCVGTAPVGAAKNAEQALPAQGAAIARDTVIDPSLMILDPSVVDSPQAQSRLDNPAGSGTGPWSFANLMKAISGDLDPADVAEQFLTQRTSPQMVNGFTTLPVRAFGSMPPESAIQGGLRRWCRTPSGKLDLSKSPFRLLAIVNRIDSRRGVNEAGQVRFIYNLLETDDTCTGQPPEVQAAAMPKVVQAAGLNVIFEFEQPAASCADVQQTAHSWYGLSTLAFGDGYNAALAAITQHTVLWSNPGRPNGSQLRDVRTNEESTPSQWFFHEFRLGGTSPDAGRQNPLLLAPPALEPDNATFGSSSALTSWIASQGVQVAAGTLLDVPLDLQGHPFAGAQSATNEQWRVNDVTQVDFAAQTCGGCHGLNGVGAHVGAHRGPVGVGRDIGTRAAMSQFLLGGFIGPPSGSGELGRRFTLLVSVANSSACGTIDSVVSAGSGRFAAAGQPLYGNWLAGATSGLSMPGDTVGLFTPGDPDSSPARTAPLDPGLPSGTAVISAPAQAGIYEMRYLNGGVSQATSRYITVISDLNYDVFANGPIAPATSANVSWAAPFGHSASDLIALYPVGVSGNAPLWSQTTGPATEGSLVVPMPSTPGTYELRFLLGDTGAPVSSSGPLEVSGPPSALSVTIQASGTPLGGVYPTLALMMGDVALQSWTVTETPQLYTYTSGTPLVAANLRVAFVNDAYAPPEDRNLAVDFLSFGGQRFDAISSQTYSRDCGSGFLQTPWMDCNGYMEFPTRSPVGQPGDGADGEDVLVHAWGSSAQGVFPTMTLSMGNELLQTWTVTGTPEDYLYHSPVPLNAGNLRIGFSNDFYDGMQDRNLAVDYLITNGAEFDSTDSHAYTQSCWEGYHEDPWMYCNGYIEFPTRGPAPR